MVDFLTRGSALLFHNNSSTEELLKLTNYAFLKSWDHALQICLETNDAAFRAAFLA